MIRILMVISGFFNFLNPQMLTADTQLELLNGVYKFNEIEKKPHTFYKTSGDTLYVKGKYIIFTYPWAEPLLFLEKEESYAGYKEEFDSLLAESKRMYKDDYKIITTDKRFISVVRNSDTVVVDRHDPERGHSREPVFLSAMLLFNDYFLINNNPHYDADRFHKSVKRYYSDAHYERVLEVKYVTTRNGVNVRDADGYIDGKLDNGEWVRVIEYTNSVLSLDEDPDGTWAVAKIEEDGHCKVRYIYNKYLGDIKDVKVYKDQICWGRELFGEYEMYDDHELGGITCFDDYFEFELVSKAYYDNIKTQSESQFKRNKDVLISMNEDGSENITLFINGDTMTYKSKLEYSGAQHIYYGDSDLLNKHLMHHTYFKAEDEYYAFIDRSTGEEMILGGFPIITPDKKKMISFFYDIYDEEFGILTYDILEDKTLKFKKQFVFLTWIEVPEVKLKWVSNDEFIIGITNAKIYNGSEIENPQYLKMRIK